MPTCASKQDVLELTTLRYVTPLMVQIVWNNVQSAICYQQNIPWNWLVPWCSKSLDGNHWILKCTAVLWSQKNETWPVDLDSAIENLWHTKCDWIISKLRLLNSVAKMLPSNLLDFRLFSVLYSEHLRLQ